MFRIIDVKVVASSDDVEQYVAEVVERVRGKHFVNLNFKRLRGDILSNSRAKDVKFLLKLPGELVVKVFERRPYYCVVSDEVYVADSDGVIYKVWEGEKCRVIVAGRWSKYEKEQVDQMLKRVNTIDGIYFGDEVKVYIGNTEVVFDPGITGEKIDFVKDVVEILKPKKVDARYNGLKVAVVK